MPVTAPAPATVPDYVGLLRRRGWLVLLLTCLGILGADLVARTVPRTYQATTSVLVQPAGQDANIVGGRTKDAINLDTEAQVVRSDAVAVAAAALLRRTVTAEELVSAVGVEVPANTAVLRISVTGPTPQHAQARSRAVAAAYLANREATARALLGGQGRALGSRLHQLNAALTRVNQRLAVVTSGAGRPQLESQRQTLINQINDLAEQNNQLTTATVRVGRVISDAALPSAPVAPNRMLYLASGAMVGLMCGIGLSVLRERFGRRIRHAGDIARRAGMPVLSVLDARTAPAGLLAPHGPGGRMFHRLRNEVVAGLDDRSRVILVTSTVDGPSGVLVAVNLAAAIARTGDDVTLVSTHHAASRELSGLLKLADGPGLTALADGTVPLGHAGGETGFVAGMRVVTTGGRDAEPLPAPVLRAALQTVRAGGGYVVIAAPSTATGAEAQSLASHSDAAIVVVPLHLTSRAQLVDTEEQLTRVGVHLLGAVVLPRSVRRPAVT
ncbi:MAG TPA: Wzz/FepE/Etk N-terminal domain-containing protein, partial [Pilimelia sp.]|nr:Wzz/FepE/Etk N-terminal domain-containing protein [Pilimelia sp.]